MEEESQYHPTGPGAWRTGDLFRFQAGLVLCVGVGNLSAQLVTADEMLLTEVAMPGDAIDAHVLHNTGLIYEYKGRAQLEQDFAEGLFRPYF